MNSKSAVAVAVLTLSTAASAAGHGDPNLQVVVGWGASRIVGAYQSDAQVRPCGTMFPYQPVTNTISFNAVRIVRSVIAFL
ncbi:MAG: hypothetical protein ACREPN_12915 [Rudaea sp.]